MDHDQGSSEIQTLSNQILVSQRDVTMHIKLQCLRWLNHHYPTSVCFLQIVTDLLPLMLCQPITWVLITASPSCWFRPLKTGWFFHPGRDRIISQHSWKIYNDYCIGTYFSKFMTRSSTTWHYVFYTLRESRSAYLGWWLGCYCLSTTGILA